MRGRLFGLMIGLIVMATGGLTLFGSTSAQSDLLLPTSAPTSTPESEIWRSVQPTADPNLVPLPRLNESLPNPTAAPDYDSEHYIHSVIPRSSGNVIRSVNFGDEDELLAALNDPATHNTFANFENTIKITKCIAKFG